MKTPKKTPTIRTKQEFVSFVYDLSQSYKSDPKSWENKDLGTFLEALAAWTDDMEGYYINHKQPVPTQPDWQTIADMLQAAKVYE